MADAQYRAQQLVDRGQLNAAVRVLEEHVRTSPRDGHAMLFLAEVAELQSDSSRALHWLKKAVNVAPNDAEVHLGAGLQYAKMRLAAEAIKRFESMLSLRPDHSMAHFHIGLVYLDLLKRPATALSHFRLVGAGAEFPFEAQFNLAKALFDLGHVDEAMQGFQECRAYAAQQNHREGELRCLEAIAIGIPGAMSADNAAILAARRAWAAAIEPGETLDDDFGGRDRSPDRLLNIGYVSSFFSGENWMKPVWGLINQHDRERFHVHLFSFGPVPGCEEGTAAATAYRPHDSDRVFDVDQVDNERVTQLIVDEAIDVLIDLNGYSDPKRLAVLLRHPAPVVIGWFNMYATTGMRAFDYLIGDRHVVLPEEEQDYRERILRVPGSYLTFDVAYPVPEVAPAPCIANGHLTFGSLCSRYKITPEVVQAWSEILKRCPTARLVLRNGGLNDASERDYLLRQFATRDIDPERIQMLGGASHREFLETYARIDIALDTFPYNGGTTTTEAIWQGVPVIAYSGPTWASRTSATLLREGRLGDWVADDLAGYVELAVTSANDPGTPSRLADLRSSMRGRLRASPVCNTRQFARDMENLYRDAWRAWCER